MGDMMSFYSEWRAEHDAQIKEYKYTLFLIRNSPLTVLGLAIIALVLLVAMFAPYLATHDPEKVVLREINIPPSKEHFFGTDDSGMDVYSRVVYGSRISLRIGAIVIAISVSVGSALGVIAGYMGGKIDEFIMRVVDVFFAIPFLILAMAVAAAIGERSLETVILAISFVGWAGYARLIRGQALSVRENQYVEAARSLGASNRRIIFRHVLPNTLAPITVQATMDMGGIILAAAGLSFIGFGAPPGTPEWGRMIADGREWLVTAWWQVTFPGLAILITVLGFNLFGDGLRDILDPRLRR